jgi:hypothetical protein
VSDNAPAQEAQFSQPVSEFLIALSIALHKNAMYPSGHPSLGPAAADVARRVSVLLADRPMVALGIARHQLILDGLATDSRQPVLRRLAASLHRHHLGAVSFTRGIEVGETSDALRLLATDAERDGPIGLQPAAGLPSWPHVRLHPLTFDRLALSEGARPTGDSQGGAVSRSAELWIGLATAALSGEPDAGSVPPSDVAVVARALDEHPHEEAYDQVIIGYLLQIARELKTSGDDVVELRQRTGRLISTMRPETLRRFIEMGGNTQQRREFVLDAADGMAVDAVIEVVKAAAEASGETISHGLMRMLSKLAAHAEMGELSTRPVADAALREQVGRLIENWQLADPNPEQYGRLLQHLATTASDTATHAGRAGTESAAVRLLQMSLEVDAAGPLIDRAVADSVHRGLAREVVALLEDRPPGSDASAVALADQLRRPMTLATILAIEPVDFETIDRLLPFAPVEAYDCLLDALALAESRTTRRRLLDRIAAAPMDLTARVAARLDNQPWYVQRNMLMLLEKFGRVPPGFSSEPWTRHSDRRVRHQAIRLQLSLPAERDRALLTALGDEDPGVVLVALTALQSGGPPAVLDALIGIANDPAAPEEHCVLAVRAAGHFDDPRALELLLQVADGGRTLLGRQKLPPRSPLLLAALQLLASRWAGERRVQPLLAAAAAAQDEQVRAAARTAP